MKDVFILGTQDPAWETGAGRRSFLQQMFGAGTWGGLGLGIGFGVSACARNPGRSTKNASVARQSALAVALQGGQHLGAGVIKQSKRLSSPAGELELWMYLPQSALYQRKLPVLYTTPPDGELVTGAKLSLRDQPQYRSWAEAGTVVMAYGTQGAVSSQATDAEFDAGVAGFMRSRGGLDDLGACLDYEARHLRELVAGRFWMGEKAAATHALMAAAMHFPLQGVVAIEPMFSAESELAEVIAQLSSTDPRGNFWRWFSPLRFASRIKTPLLLGVSQEGDLSSGPGQAFLSSLPKSTRVQSQRFDPAQPWRPGDEPVASFLAGLKIQVGPSAPKA